MPAPGGDRSDVGTIMTRRVVKVSMDDSLCEVREIFERSSFHHLVVEDGKRVVGVVSDRDLLKNISPFLGKISEREQDAFTLQRRVHQIMTRKLVACSPGTTLAEAGRMMTEHNVSCLPVLDEHGVCVGIVTMRDMLAWAMVRCAGSLDRCPVPRAA